MCRLGGSGSGNDESQIGMARIWRDGMPHPELFKDKACSLLGWCCAQMTSLMNENGEINQSNILRQLVRQLTSLSYISHVAKLATPRPTPQALVIVM